ncbi:bifunctional enoyl-CoA hydratase/phosphate acetyltransferase [Acuticoccus sediminis]|uniref:bifunctional enoyl-CoA hydratase/phosphate acetyltransferase n=1 Tax=Acuticoccus sediminis TaxID=2184697 RepID=UPI001CFE75F6|nr:bifunctional enoyl-CoA hydratase/phosphate acetyltransferase [Acuticoccus sediminis]
MEYIENRTFEELQVGDSAEITRTLRHDDIELFAVMSGDVNPAHVDPEYAASDMFHRVIAHGMWGGALISAVLGTELPGPGTIYLDQSLQFRRPVGLGDTVTVRVTVAEKYPDTRRLKLACECLNQEGKQVIVGEALVIAPSEKVRRPRVTLPEVHLHERGARHRELVKLAAPYEPIRVAVVQPVNAASLHDALDAKEEGLIEPVLVGPEAKIRRAAEEIDRSLDGVTLEAVPHSHAAAARAVELARTGKVDALMKGAIAMDELMDAVLAPEALATERRASHVHVLDVPTYPKPLLITDAALLAYPTLADKRDIVRNAVDLAKSLGIEAPKVAILSASEVVDPRIRSTMEAAALCKMAERGQIAGAVVDGPLAFDSAISRKAAAANGVAGLVAGDADVLVVPDLEAGTLLVKELVHLAGADSAGIILGARVPAIIPGRSDGALPSLASAALAKLYLHRGDRGTALASGDPSREDAA